MLLSIKVLTLLQAFLLVAVCCALFATLLKASDTAILKMTQTLQQSKVMNVQARVGDEVIPVVSTVRDYAQAFAQDPRAALCFNASDVSITSVMQKLLRIMKIHPRYQYVYINYAVNETWMAECTCGRFTCSLFYQETQRVFDVTNKTVFNLSEYKYTTIRSFENETYVATIKKLAVNQEGWTLPDYYFDQDQKMDLLLFTMSSCLEGNATNCTRAVSVDVDLNFLSQMLHELRSSGKAASTERLLLCEKSSGIVLASSIPRDDGSVYSFGVENKELDMREKDSP